MAKSFARMLSFNGGFVDTAGFMVLHGLFTAHVTGNFVTLAAALAEGEGGAIVKLLALPAFCVVVVVTRLASVSLNRHLRSALPELLGTQCVLLTLAAAYAISHGPFGESDNIPMLILGILLVAAMAIQNAVHRMHLSKSPPSTLMTGTTTQLMLDLADLFLCRSGAERDTIRSRLSQFAPPVVAFGAGCALAAAAVTFCGQWCFAFPPVVTALCAIKSHTLAEPRPA